MVFPEGGIESDFAMMFGFQWVVLFLGEGNAGSWHAGMPHGHADAVSGCAWKLYGCRGSGVA